MTTISTWFWPTARCKLPVVLFAFLFLWLDGLLYAQSGLGDVQQPSTIDSAHAEALDVVESAVQDLGFFLSLHDKVADNSQLLQQIRENFFPLFDQRAIARLVLRSRFGDASRGQREYLECLAGLAFFNAHLDTVAATSGSEKDFYIGGVLPVPDYPDILNVDVLVSQADESVRVNYRLINRGENQNWRIVDVRNGSDGLLSRLSVALSGVHDAAVNINADKYLSAVRFLVQHNNGKLIAAKHWCTPVKEDRSKGSSDVKARVGNDRFEINTSINGQSHNVFVEVTPDGKVIYQDDIILDVDDNLSSAVSQLDFRRLRLWGDAVVPYIIDETISGEDITLKTRVLRAIEEWDDKTPVSFVEASEDNKNVLVFTAGEGCRSYLGMRGGVQHITLGSRCSYGAVLHEIGHALGLIHEHNRDDRDSYVSIKLRNVLYEKEHNFYKHPAGFPVSDGYCYSSIMHYPEHAFAISRELKTIEVKGRYRIGQRDRLSSCDVNRVSTLYAPLVKTRFSGAVPKADDSQ